MEHEHRTTAEGEKQLNKQNPHQVRRCNGGSAIKEYPRRIHLCSIAHGFSATRTSGEKSPGVSC